MPSERAFTPNLVGLWYGISEQKKSARQNAYVLSYSQEIKSQEVITVGGNRRVRVVLRWPSRCTHRLAARCRPEYLRVAQDLS